MQTCLVVGKFTTPSWPLHLTVRMVRDCLTYLSASRLKDPLDCSFLCWAQTDMAEQCPLVPPSQCALCGVRGVSLPCRLSGSLVDLGRAGRSEGEQMLERWEVSADARGTPTLRGAPVPSAAQAVVNAPAA